MKPVKQNRLHLPGVSEYYVLKGYRHQKTSDKVQTEEPRNFTGDKSLRETATITRTQLMSTVDPVKSPNRDSMTAATNAYFAMTSRNARLYTPRPQTNPGSQTSRSLSSHKQSLYTEEEHGKASAKVMALRKIERSNSKHETPFEALQHCRSMEEFADKIAGTEYYPKFEYFLNSPKFRSMTPVQLYEILSGGPPKKEKAQWSFEDFATKVAMGAYYHFKIPTKGRATPLVIKFYNKNDKMYNMNFIVYMSDKLEKPTALSYDRFAEGDTELIVEAGDHRLLFVQESMFIGIYAREELFVHVRCRFGGAKRVQKVPADWSSRVLPSLQDFWEKMPAIQDAWLAEEVYRPCNVTHGLQAKIPNRQRETLENRRVMEVNAAEEKLFSMHKTKLMSHLRQAELKYREQLAKKLNFQRRWMNIVKWLMAMETLQKYVVVRSQQIKKNQVLAFRLIMFRSTYGRYIKTAKGTTFRDRLTLDVKLGLAVVANTVMKQAKSRAFWVVDFFSRGLIDRLPMVLHFQVYLTRVLRIQQKWKKYSKRKQALREFVAAFWDRYILEIYMDLKADVAKHNKASANDQNSLEASTKSVGKMVPDVVLEKKVQGTTASSPSQLSSDSSPRLRGVTFADEPPSARSPSKRRKTMRLSKIVNNIELRDVIVDLYLTRCRQQYLIEMENYRNLWHKVTPEKRKVSEFSEFFKTAVGTKFKDRFFGLNHSRSTVEKQERVLLQHGSSQFLNMPKPRFFVLPSKARLQELLKERLQFTL